MIAMVVVITGANRGIGYEIACHMLELGHWVIAGCRKSMNALELKSLQETHGDKLKILDLDVCSPSSRTHFLKSIGHDHIDVLINNAGVFLDGEKSWSSINAEEMHVTFATNTIAPVLLTQEFLPLLKKSKNPRIANITSKMGSIGDNSSGGSLAYRMSKTSLNMFTKTVSLNEKTIISLAIHPGWVQTEMGGPRAPLSAKASADGICRIINGATLKDSGRFFDYSANELPW